MKTSETVKLIYIRGIPGSGKTYLADELSKQLGSDVIVLDPDAIDLNSNDYVSFAKAQSEEGVDAALLPYRYLRLQAYQAIERGNTIIWNQPFTNREIFRKAVSRLIDHAHQTGRQLQILIVEVSIDIVTAKKRVDDRKQAGGHGPTDGRFMRYSKDFESYQDEGIATLVVRGEGEVSESVHQIIDSLKDRSVGQN